MKVEVRPVALEELESFEEVDENLNLYFSRKSSITKNFPDNIGFLKMTGDFTGEGAFRGSHARM